MIMDELNEFGDALALSTAGTGLAAIGDTIDLGNPAHDLGIGKQMYLVIQVQTAVTSGGSATVSFQLVSDAQDPPAADGTETLHFATEDIAIASLTAGARLIIPVPVGTATLQEYERYLGLQQNVGTAALTAGAVDAFLTFDPTGWKSYPDGQN